jgi:hypothetical protein
MVVYTVIRGNESLGLERSIFFCFVYTFEDCFQVGGGLGEL